MNLINIITGKTNKKQHSKWRWTINDIKNKKNEKHELNSDLKNVFLMCDQSGDVKWNKKGMDKRETKPEAAKLLGLKSTSTNSLKI